MLVAPSEPASLRALGATSQVPESYGVDYLYTAGEQLVGVQRKEYHDLIASVQGDRVYRELLSMKQLDVAVWLIEGRPQWTSDGHLLTAPSWTRKHETGFVLSVQAKGYWVVWQGDQAGTRAFLEYLPTYLSKEHSSLSGRPKPQKSEWGRVTDRDWGCHLWQSFPGIGPGVAGALWDAVGVPLRLTVAEKELSKVKGVGPKRAAGIVRALENGAGNDQG
jgi:ERCC4-type nuclease